LKKWILIISASFDEKTNSFFKRWQSRPNEKIVLFPEKREKKLYWDTFLRKSETSSLKLFTSYSFISKIVFPCKKEQKRNKKENSERFSVTQTNFDNDASLDVELMKENLTSSLEIDKIKWVLSFSLSLSHFLDYRNKRLFFNPVRRTAGG
jgi:hypothetical protein